MTKIRHLIQEFRGCYWPDVVCHQLPLQRCTACKTTGCANDRSGERWRTAKGRSATVKFHRLISARSRPPPPFSIAVVHDQASFAPPQRSIAVQDTFWVHQFRDKVIHQLLIQSQCADPYQAQNRRPSSRVGPGRFGFGGYEKSCRDHDR